MRSLAVRFILFGRLSYCIIVANIQKIYYLTINSVKKVYFLTKNAIIDIQDVT